MVKKYKQAVVVIHGMGEQIPMETLRSFVDTTWTTDDNLIDPARPDANTGGARDTNAVWSKPDARNRNYELRRITTEESNTGMRTDFYEFYWAHLMSGTNWEHFKAWIVDILWRSPRRVPRDVIWAWLWLWGITISVGAFLVYSLIPFEALQLCEIDQANETTCDTGKKITMWAKPIIGAIGTVLLGALVNTILLKYFGDVARYVKATPLNVARRQEIRTKGVELLETLMGTHNYDYDRRDKSIDLPEWKTEYDRIIIVSHSLGTMVAYDILLHSFARINRYTNKDPKSKQPHRNALENLVRQAIKNGGDLDIDAFRALQKKSLAELKKQGSPWIVSDFITLGSPLTHAEFLLAYDENDMRRQQSKRILPTCPPMMEWDQRTKRQHFSYWPGKWRDDKKDGDAESEYFRTPHHAALFAFTRWTNLFSKSKFVLWGDLVSGPVSNHFGLKAKDSKDATQTLVKGILETTVMPERDKNMKPKGRVPFFSHTKYWDAKLTTNEADKKGVPHHIQQLRQAINLLDE